MEQELRARLRLSFDITLPQFDVMAELERAGEPQTMSELSRRLLVSGGNVTGVVDRLERAGYVERRPLPTDRRVQLVALVEKGRREFAAMAAAHEQWLTELFEGLSLEEVRLLNELLGRAKAVVAAVAAQRKD
ncbi:MAG TPA: MarR family transcriptional regulator [Gammaproteobacteria bacterium]|nr:MarR family transcriptional regulator [Gammaproteobacteria bacterium]